MKYIKTLLAVLLLCGCSLNGANDNAQAVNASNANEPVSSDEVSGETYRKMVLEMLKGMGTVIEPKVVDGTYQYVFPNLEYTMITKEPFSDDLIVFERDEMKQGEHSYHLDIIGYECDNEYYGDGKTPYVSYTNFEVMTYDEMEASKASFIGRLGYRVLAQKDMDTSVSVSDELKAKLDQAYVGPNTLLDEFQNHVSFERYIDDCVAYNAPAATSSATLRNEKISKLSEAGMVVTPSFKDGKYYYVFPHVGYTMVLDYELNDDIIVFERKIQHRGTDSYAIELYAFDDSTKGFDLVHDNSFSFQTQAEFDSCKTESDEPCLHWVIAKVDDMLVVQGFNYIVNGSDEIRGRLEDNLVSSDMLTSEFPKHVTFLKNE